MNLQEHYTQLYKASVHHIRSGAYEIDPNIHNDHDNRFGLSLIIKPPESVRNEIQKFLSDLKSVAPKQYFYPNTDIHITLLSIVSCYEGFDQISINVNDYINTINSSLVDVGEMQIICKGITASPSCVLIQGFPTDQSIQTLRDKIRSEIRSAHLKESMDARYLIQTAHATVFRFSDTLEHNDEFLSVLDSYRNHNFGSFKVDQLHLVYNDWYHREHRSETLYKFEL
ncbi:mutarotase [Gelidibacter salicanalis]|uniref:Mutarotase n=1 Tax=Gelidibacter salicanalis TaxID=291193 RepID=A0A5C7ABJ3_9FLAO|nr:mutarotase [Gelidibacter salicanalis]TXE05986.1 mutarotase [Gelidibacter salicanalis]